MLNFWHGFILGLLVGFAALIGFIYGVNSKLREWLMALERIQAQNNQMNEIHKELKSEEKER